MGLLSETQNATIRTGTDVVPSRPKWEAFRAPNGLELHPPFPKDIGTMCGLGKGAARRLGLTTILAPASSQARLAWLSARQSVSISELLGAVLLCQDEEVGRDLRDWIWQDV